MKVYIEITKSLKGEEVKWRWHIKKRDRSIFASSLVYFDRRKFRRDLRNLKEHLYYSGIGITNIEDYLKRKPKENK